MRFITKMNKIPIFIITKDRLKCLRLAISSYRKFIKTPFEIIIHDNNSSYKPTLRYLKSLESIGIKIYRNTKPFNGINEELITVSGSIKDYLNNNKDTKYYIVTDPDIILDSVNGDILEFYIYILEKTGIDVVGPSLRIDNLPDFYPFKRKVIKHESKFWKNSKSITFKNNIYTCYNANIDTTFGMYKSSYEFSRPTIGIRTGSPYYARHFDWYINPKKLSGDQKFYINKTYKISHWCKNIKPC